MPKYKFKFKFCFYYDTAKQKTARKQVTQRKTKW